MQLHSTRHGTFLSNIAIAFALLFLTSGSLIAQPEFDQHLSYDQIQELLQAGINEPNLRKQALAFLSALVAGAGPLSGEES